MKTVLGNVASGFNVSRINNNFDIVEDALNTKVLWRDNPTGEPNTMEQELDMNGHDIYNADSVYAKTLYIDGVVFDGTGVGIVGPPGPPGPPGSGGGGSTSYEVNVKDHGAVGDGLANDTAAIQSAINAALALGATTYFPPGTYVISSPGIIIDLTSRPAITTSLFYKKTQLRGDGQSSSQILGDIGDYAMITVQGGTVAASGAIFSQQTFKGLYIDKVDNLGKILKLDNLAFASFEDMYLSHGEYQIYATDVISSDFKNVQLRHGTKGLTAFQQDFSPPNAWTFTGCHISANTQYGALFYNPSTITFVGGAIEGNGSVAGNTYSVNSWGLKTINDNAFHGGVGLSLEGVYFEHNAGLADVWMATNNGKATNKIAGCLFHRIDSGQYTKHNVYLESVGSGVSMEATLVGCGFKSFNSYVPSAARPYLQVGDSSSGASRFSWMGCMFENAAELPLVTNYAQAAGTTEWIGGTGDPLILTANKTGLRIAETTPIGGTGFKSPFVVDLKVVNGTLSHEYGEYVRVSNYEATGTPITVGKYIENWKYTNGGKSWGQVIDVRDASGASGAGALVGLQVNMYANGGVGENARVLIDMVVGKFGGVGTAPLIQSALRVSPVGSAFEAGFDQAINIKAYSKYFFSIDNGATGLALLDTQFAGIISYFARLRGDVAPYYSNTGTGGWDNSTHEGRETTGSYPLRPHTAYGGYTGRLALQIDGLNGYYLPVYGDSRFM